MDTLSKNPLMGFIAGALAVITAHQAIVYILANYVGLLPATARAWNMGSGVAPWGVPQLLNNMFWGGLWGALFSLIHDKLPGGVMWLKGLIYGLIVVVLSNWIFLPLIKGTVFGVTTPPQVLFVGWDPKRMLAGALILGGFGIATAIFYSLLAGRRN